MIAEPRNPYLAPRGFALASPLPLGPRTLPRPVWPLLVLAEVDPPRLLMPMFARGGPAGFVNLVATDLVDAGGLSMKEVSVVLQRVSTARSLAVFATSRRCLQKGRLGIVIRTHPRTNLRRAG